ncbi:AMP-binding protein [Gordonia insulae]|uniref:Short-chain-fatty-acid--CoA ligase n=1 Tax=Gordonia insulae TaxID=2420509 RepID=A0A3G8JMC0_9ACTN|nr:AMP-binding protein [Gordonia insulae]AZG45742.1 Short-chain-fatty-acid--CoA ligase [Gordonia insulae]
MTRQVPAELAEKYIANGWWTTDTVGDVLTRGLQDAPDGAFRIHSSVRPWTGTFADVDDVARRLAAGLRERGVGPGDVVAFQLPNWMEAAATFWASAFLGAAVVPIVHFYGRKEVSYILDEVRPKVFITPERFGRLEYDLTVCADVPIVGVVDRDFDDLLADEPLTGTLPVDPAEAALIAFTSGTTRNPKGVLHSHYSLVHETRQLAGWYPPDRGHQLTAAPVGHFIGMINAFLIPVLDGTDINLTDVWDPGQALELMRTENLTVGGGATYYMTSLLEHPDFTPEHLPSMKYAGLGGSSVPSAVTTRLADLGITVFRSYGSTEHPSITGSWYDAPEDKRLHTDGRPLPGVEITLAEDGEILSRGPDLCMGYTDPELTSRMFDESGWYHTGDIGVLDDDGYLKITDRKSDIIIRGGENISALEVEEVLLGMATVADAVVVAVPDERLGERAAAVVRIKADETAPTLDELRIHFSAVGLAKQKWPEEIHVVDDFPRTASGKIQKFRIRADIVSSQERE